VPQALNVYNRAQYLVSSSSPFMGDVVNIRLLKEPVPGQAILLTSRRYATLTKCSATRRSRGPEVLYRV
jgi:hypothetical protein